MRTAHSLLDWARTRLQVRPQSGGWCHGACRGVMPCAGASTIQSYHAYWRPCIGWHEGCMSQAGDLRITRAGSGSGGGSSVDLTPIFTPMRRPWHPSRGRSEGPAARGAERRTNGCQPAQRMSTPAAVRLMTQHRPAGVSHAARGKCAAFGNRLVGSSGPPGGDRGSLVDMLLTLCRAQRIWLDC